MHNLNHFIQAIRFLFISYAVDFIQTVTFIARIMTIHPLHFKKLISYIIYYLIEYSVS